MSFRMCEDLCGQVYFVMSMDLCGQVYVVYMVYGLAVCCEFEWCSCVGMVSLDKNKLIFFMFSYLFLNAVINSSFLLNSANGFICFIYVVYVDVYIHPYCIL